MAMLRSETFPLILWSHPHHAEDRPASRARATRSGRLHVLPEASAVAAARCVLAARSLESSAEERREAADAALAAARAAGLPFGRPAAEAERAAARGGGAGRGRFEEEEEEEEGEEDAVQALRALRDLELLAAALDPAGIATDPPVLRARRSRSERLGLDMVCVCVLCVECGVASKRL